MELRYADASIVTLGSVQPLFLFISLHLAKYNYPLAYIGTEALISSCLKEIYWYRSSN